MTIETGNKLPKAKFNILDNGNMTVVTSNTLFDGKKVAMFALPGAFTPTCSATHLPGFIAKFDELIALGIDSVVCLSVNDAHVMSAWKQSSNANNIVMLADGEALFTKALDLSINIPGMGVRSRRYSMIVENGVVCQLNLDEPGKFEVSDVDTLLTQLKST